MDEEPNDEAALTHITNQHYRGIARISLRSLHFDGPLHTEHRELSTKILDRLHHIFKVEGCRRLDEEMKSIEITSGRARRQYIP